MAITFVLHLAVGVQERESWTSVLNTKFNRYTQSPVNSYDEVNLLGKRSMTSSPEGVFGVSEAGTRTEVDHQGVVEITIVPGYALVDEGDTGVEVLVEGNVISVVSSVLLPRLVG